MSGFHSLKSPSGYSMWGTCPPSPYINQHYDDVPSEYAARGTFLHTVSDLALSLGFDPIEIVGYKETVEGFHFELEAEDAEGLQDGIDFTNEQPGFFYGEHRVPLDEWLGEGESGTADRIVVGENRLFVGDLKGGHGVPVSPVRNGQAMLYALGAWKKFAPHLGDDAEVVIHIDQPFCAGGGGLWKTSIKALRAFGEEVKAKAAAVHPDAPRVASAQGCLWCKAKNDCATYDAFNLEMLGAEFDDLDDGEVALPDLESLTPARRATVLKHRPMIEKWLKGLHAVTLADALAGRDAGGLKAVEGRKSPDKWADPDSAEAILSKLVGTKAFAPRKIITPTQGRKSISPEDYKSLVPFITFGERKPSLVDSDDDRPALLLTDEFDELD